MGELCLQTNGAKSCWVLFRIHVQHPQTRSIGGRGGWSIYPFALIPNWLRFSPRGINTPQREPPGSWRWESVSVLGTVDLSCR